MQLPQSPQLDPMRILVITPPEIFVTLEEAKAHLRVEQDDDHEDDLIDALVSAACAHIDGPEGWLGRAVGQQTLELRRCSFPACIDLPYPTVTEVTSILYDDADGAEQTLSTSLYRVYGHLIARAPDATWPATESTPESVRVQYEAGYEEVPAPIKQAVLLMVGDMFKHRESTQIGAISSVPMSMTVDRLLAPYRVWRV